MEYRTPYQEYCQLIDEVLDHDCVNQYTPEGMCANCRSKYARAQALEKEYGDTPLWEQLVFNF